MVMNKFYWVVILLVLNGCVAVGYFDSDDYRTVVSQGHEMEKMNRFIPAKERYYKALRIAEKNNDNLRISFAKMYLGTFYRNSSRYNSLYSLDLSIKYLKESLEFYETYPVPFSTDVYTALTEVYDKKGDKKSACFYLNKLQKDYNKKVVSNSKYAPNGKGYKSYYNATGKKFKFFYELIEYYDNKIGCNII